MKLMRLGTVPMLAGTVVSALGFYTLSLTVSSERTEVERLQRQIASNMQDVRALEAELKTRARLPVLQKWNDEVLALGAPLPRQFVDTPMQLVAYAPGTSREADDLPEMQLAVLKPEPAPAPVPSVAPPVAEVRQIAYRSPAPAAVSAPAPAPAVAIAPAKPKPVATPDPLGGLIGDIEQAASAERKTLVRKVTMQ
jgi:hypothetical protein